MKLWGLTGGIASGKSTVAHLLKGHKIPVIDADELYHTLIAPRDGQPSRLTHEIITAFGNSYLTPDNALNRKFLAQRVFGDADAKLRLESITHPAIAQAASFMAAELEAAGHPLAFYDVPLLYERHLESRFEKIVVVWVSKKTQIARLRARDNLSLKEAQLRIASQESLDEKRRRADFVINNDKDQYSLETELMNLIEASPLGRSRKGQPI